MAKKYWLLFIISSFITIMAKSQDLKPLDKMHYQIKYEYKYSCDSNNLANIRFATMLLKIGNNCSYFITQNANKYDSLKIATKYETDLQKVVNAFIQYPVRKISSFRILKIYSKKNMIFFYNDLSPVFYQGEQHIDFNWQMIAGSDTSILGHTCKKASTQFAGRKYNAWFAPDIPISDGPYKFSGLPGLILQISSTDGQHSFTCTGIAQFKEPIDFYFYRAKDFNTCITAEDNIKAITLFHQQFVNDLITGKSGISDEAAKQRAIQNVLSENNFIEKYCK